MGRYLVLSRTRSFRSRLAAVFAATGLVAASSGLVMLAAPAAQADHHRVGLCHRDASAGYGFQLLPQSAIDGGHATHFADEPGEVLEFPDYIIGSPGVPTDVDTNAELEAWCVNGQLPATLPVLSITFITACEGAGSVARPSDSALVTYSIEGDSWSGLEGDVTVTATLTNAASGFNAPTGNWTVNGRTATQTIQFGSSDALCSDPTGTLVDLDFTEAGCGTYGSITQPTNLPNVSYSIEDGEWTGLSGEYDVTATLTNGATSFDDQSVQDWVVSGNTATQTVNVGIYEEACGERTGALVDLDFTEAGCGIYGSITQPTNLPNVSYSIEDGEWTGLSGEYDVTATLTNRARAFNDLSTQNWVVSGNTATQTVDLGTYTESCEAVVGTIGDLGISQAGCETWGTITQPANPGNVRYSLDREAFGGQLSGVYVVTAQLINDATAFTTPLPADWFLGTGGQTATRTVNLGTYTATCGGNPGGGGETPGNGGNPGGGGGTVTPTNVTPLEPSWTEPTCSTPAGLQYRSVDGVAYVTEGDVAPGKRVVVRSEALAGHSFADGTVTWWAHTFDTPEGCDAGGNPGGGDEGEEPSVGKPSPTVKGVQKFRPPTGKGDNVQPGTGGPHAVPTAVAAGLTDLSGGHGSPSTFSSPQLAQALVAGGLLLLVVGGGLGLGRRTNGAHEF